MMKYVVNLVEGLTIAILKHEKHLLFPPSTMS